MSSYPTPPPTSSPKGDSYKPYSSKLPAQETYFQDSYGPSTAPTTALIPHLSSDYQVTQTQTQDPTTNPSYGYNNPLIPQKHSTSSYEPSIPPRRTSTPTKTRTSPGPYRRQSPRPLYYSPTNPIPTPYNLSRPQPRPGFLRRMLNKITKWMRSLIKWARNNPVKAGLLTFLPVLAGAGALKAAHGVAIVGKYLLEGMGANFEDKKAKLDKEKEKLEKEAKEVKKEVEKEIGWGMDEFKGFGNSKGGPMNGIMKVLQMGVNHWCKLTPSAIPRAASILLELYFLELHDH